MKTLHIRIYVLHERSELRKILQPWKHIKIKYENRCIKVSTQKAIQRIKKKNESLRKETVKIKAEINDLAIWDSVYLINYWNFGFGEELTK